MKSIRITVSTADGSETFNATDVSTDEHNNLEIMYRNIPVALFNKDYWEAALYGERSDDGE